MPTHPCPYCSRPVEDKKVGGTQRKHCSERCRNKMHAWRRLMWERGQTIHNTPGMPAAFDAWFEGFGTGEGQDRVQVGVYGDGEAE